MTRRVIINADDFGLAPGVNRGILEAFREGVLTSTTMLVNLRYFNEAVALARENPDLPVGIHMSLLWGPPVSDPAAVPSLLDRGAVFPRSLSVLARRYFMGRLDPGEVETEFRAQVRKFLDAGLRPTHLDTHKHIHCLPGVLQALIAVAREYGIEKIRLPYEKGWPLRSTPEGPAAPPTSWQAAAKRDLIRFLCRGSRESLQKAEIGTTDHFIGIRHQAVLNSDVLSLILDSLPNGVTEIMCHPGYVDEPMREFSRIPPHRERELEGLKSPAIREQVSRNGIDLIHYGEL